MAQWQGADSIVFVEAVDLELMLTDVAKRLAPMFYDNE